MKKSPKPCPHCGAKAEVDRPFSRFIKILFWYFDLWIPLWMPSCSEYCDGFMNDKDNSFVSGATKKEAIEKWNAYVDSVGGGLDGK